MARRSIITVLTLMVVLTAACSSSTTSAQPKSTTTPTTKVHKLSSQTCQVVSAGLKQVNSDVLAIGLSAVGANGSSSSAVSSSISSIRGLLPGLESALSSIVPKSTATSWGSSMTAYATGLAQAARSGDAGKINTFSSQFHASERGSQMNRQLNSIEGALAKACASSPAG